MTRAEQLLRAALAEYVSRVQPRPALHLIRARTAASGGAETAEPETPKGPTT